MSTVSIGGRQLTNLRFADDIDGLAGSETKLRQLVSVEKTKLMTNNNNGMTTDVQIVENTLDEVQSFKYLSAIISEEGSKP